MKRGGESCMGTDWRGWMVARHSLIFRGLGIMWEVWIGVVVGYGGGGGMEYILRCGTGGKEWGVGIEYIPLEKRRMRGTEI